MGHVAWAIMLGVREDDSERWCGEGGDSGILGAFATATIALVNGLQDKRVPYYAALRRVRPCRSDRDPIVWGFPVACGGSARAGVPDLTGLPFEPDEVERRWPKALARARRRWGRFARFCKARGFGLTKARLWLVEIPVS